MRRGSEAPAIGRRIHHRGSAGGGALEASTDGPSVGWRRRAVATDAVRGLFELIVPRAAGTFAGAPTG